MHTIARIETLPQVLEESHALTLTGTGWQNHGNGGSDGARTRHKSNKHWPSSDLPSQIASQSLGADLAEVVNAWGELAVPLRAAILAIIRSAREGGE